MADFNQWSKEDAEKAKKAAGPDRELLRIEAFSDGVFAVAITLLVLNLQPPPLWHKPLLSGLVGLLPEVLGYVVSFLTILVMWMNHHRLFTLTKRTNTWLLLTNGLLLMGIVFVPFPTAVLAKYLANPSTPADELTAVLFYTGTFVILSILFNLLRWCITSNEDLVDQQRDKLRIEGITRQYLMGPVMYLAAFFVAFLSPEMSIAMNLLYAIFFAIPGLTFAKPEPLDES
jgi:uncharacterized membrane protein